MQSVEGLSDDSHIDTVARDLTLASEEFWRLLQELIGLYEQDSRGDYLEEAQLSEENETLNRALLLLDNPTNCWRQDLCVVVIHRAIHHPPKLAALPLDCKH